MPQPFVRRVVLVVFVAAGAFGSTNGQAATDVRFVPHHDSGQIQIVVDALLGRLEMPDRVAVVLVADNPLLVSVERHPDAEGFLLSVQDSFIGTLTEPELEAVIAHELGHVWIFTHHPYLHTEQLANRIAQRVVSRDTLAQVYLKVWKRTGTEGNLAIFLGPEPAVLAAAPGLAPPSTAMSTDEFP